MTESQPPAPTPGYVVPFNEEEAQNALIEVRGDLFMAAQHLRVTALRLSRSIQASPTLQGTMEYLSQLDKRRAITDAQIHEAVSLRMGLYRVAGLDALHDLATMPINENSAQNQVKLAAAARLAGGLEGAGSGGEMGDTFRELRELYESHAPRLKVVRERTTTTVEMVPTDRGEDDPEPIESVVEPP